MSDLFVRTATRADDVFIDELARCACAEQDRHRGSWVRPPGVDPEGACLTLVAGFGSTVLGVVRAREGLEGTWGVELIHVDEEGRGVGIGDLLVIRLMSELSSFGARRLVASAQPGDRALKNLFERHGLVARTILVGRDL